MSKYNDDLRISFIVRSQVYSVTRQQTFGTFVLHRRPVGIALLVKQGKCSILVPKWNARTRPSFRLVHDKNA